MAFPWKMIGNPWKSVKIIYRWRCIVWEIIYKWQDFPLAPLIPVGELNGLDIFIQVPWSNHETAKEER